MALQRKRHNRAVRRRLELGQITEEDAQAQFQISPQSKRARAQAAGSEGTGPKRVPPPPAPPAPAHGVWASSWQTAPQADCEPPQADCDCEAAQPHSSGAGGGVPPPPPPAQARPWQKLRDYKGEGKGGSLGLTVEKEDARTTEMAAAKERRKNIPIAPNAFTEADVDQIFADGYFSWPETPFWDGKDLCEIDAGSHVLWKDVPMGKNGGRSTKTVFYHGECHGWHDKEFIYVS